MNWKKIKLAVSLAGFCGLLQVFCGGWLFTTSFLEAQSSSGACTTYAIYQTSQQVCGTNQTTPEDPGKCGDEYGALQAAIDAYDKALKAATDACKQAQADEKARQAACSDPTCAACKTATDTATASAQKCTDATKALAAAKTALDSARSKFNQCLCFASVAVWDLNRPALDLLRHFRDKVLQPLPYGKRLIHFYYHDFSPPAVEAMNHSLLIKYSLSLPFNFLMSLLLVIHGITLHPLFILFIMVGLFITLLLRGKHPAPLARK